MPPMRLGDEIFTVLIYGISWEPAAAESREDGFRASSFAGSHFKGETQASFCAQEPLLPTRKNMQARKLVPVPAYLPAHVYLRQ